MRSVELFTGCGGLALGLARAGFEHISMIEKDAHSVRNLQHNKTLGLEHIAHWPVLRGDVRDVDWRPYAGADLVAGGPPCQPFSIGGKHRGHTDERDMWPEVVRAVREVEPKAFLFENVRGLARPAFASYLRWIELSLATPQIVAKTHEDWTAHLARLEHCRSEARYHVVFLKVNAADYGAPQRRHRVVFLGVRKDLVDALETPRPTHSHERLLWDQWVTGEYWLKHGMTRPANGSDNRNDAKIVEKLRQNMLPPCLHPWLTCRDTLNGLGEPDPDNVPNHNFQPGAKIYVGHTGSPLDESAKALKAGDHGVPGGENMMVLPNGAVRYFTVREAARLQGLPDEYEFVGTWSENMRQLGNAVPVMLAESLGCWLGRTLASAERAKTEARAAA